MAIPFASLVAEIEDLDPDSAGPAEFWEDVFVAGVWNGKAGQVLLDRRRSVEKGRPVAHQLIALVSQLSGSAGDFDEELVGRGADLYEQLTASGSQLDTVREAVLALARQERARLEDTGERVPIRITDSLTPELAAPVPIISVPFGDEEKFTYWLELGYVESLTACPERFRTNLRTAAGLIFYTFACRQVDSQARGRVESLRPVLSEIVAQVTGERLHGYWLIRRCRATAQPQDRRVLATALCYGLRSHIESVGKAAAAVGRGRATERPHHAPDATRHPDGPAPDGWLWWRGRPHKTTPTLSRLLEAVWSASSVETEEVVEKVWGDGEEVSDNAIKCAISRLNKVLAGCEIPWEYANRGGKIRRQDRTPSAGSKHDTQSQSGH